MPAEDIEIQEAEEEGAIFKFLVSPKEIVANNGRVSGVLLDKMTLGEPDASGRRRPVPTGEEEFLPVDNVIAAIGQEVVPGPLAIVGVNKWDNIVVDPSSLMTSIPGIFAGGDCVTGPGIAIEAVAQGRQAADTISAFLRGQEVKYEKPFLVEKTDITPKTMLMLPGPPPIFCFGTRGTERQLPSGKSPYGGRYPGGRAPMPECGCQDYFECRLISMPTSMMFSRRG